MSAIWIVYLLYKQNTVNKSVRFLTISDNFSVGDVIVNKLLEGSSVVQCKSLKAKMINGENVELVAAESIEVGAMYSLQSAITSATKGNVDLGLMQGNTKVSQ